MEGIQMTEQNRRYVQKEIGRLLSEIWRVRGLAEQEYGAQHPITRKLDGMHGEAQELLDEKTAKKSNLTKREKQERRDR